MPATLPPPPGSPDALGATRLFGCVTALDEEFTEELPLVAAPDEVVPERGMVELEPELAEDDPLDDDDEPPPELT